MNKTEMRRMNKGHYSPNSMQTTLEDRGVGTRKAQRKAKRICLDQERGVYVDEEKLTKAERRAIAVIAFELKKFEGNHRLPDTIIIRKKDRAKDEKRLDAIRERA